MTKPIDLAAMNRYVAGLLDPSPAGQLARADLEPHELRLVDRLKGHETEVQRAEARYEQLQREIQSCEAAIVSARGRGSAVAETLWAEYLELRGTKTETAEEPKPNGETPVKAAPKRAEAPTA